MRWNSILLMLFTTILLCACSYSKQMDSHENTVTIGDKNGYLILEAKPIDDVAASEDKFKAFFELLDSDSDDATIIADGYGSSNFRDKIKITRISDKNGYVEYAFSNDKVKKFSITNKNEMLGQNAEYIQFKDMNSDGNDEILVSYYTRNTTIYEVSEFYVYSVEGDEFIQIMSYNYHADSEDNIAKLLNDSDYKRMPIADVSLSENGLLLAIDDGKKVDGVYYPKGYSILINSK
ncbi:hypothetical protein D6853_00025 [Butyrivibrio sp. X503]|uniref:hypothetical protein n=1 Tax=Butyrivibrio sp. X503 TaxID=2364878 RepID=UPI000EA877E1|nr:hypothetical protein [Butyrivibrio sp. X503]RKM57967.1 hypothetical protein D6853_00025 [Butyrivibrio sp. X503]